MTMMRPDARYMKHLGSPHQIGHQIRPKAWPPKWSVFGKDRSQLPNDIATWTPKPNTDVRPGPGAYNLNRQSKWKATSRSGCTWGRRWLGFVSFVFLFVSFFQYCSSIVNQHHLVNWRLKQTQAATISCLYISVEVTKSSSWSAGVYYSNEWCSNEIWGLDAISTRSWMMGSAVAAVALSWFVASDQRIWELNESNTLPSESQGEKRGRRSLKDRAA